MNLEMIKFFSEKRDGGLKKLAADIGMSEQNLHRCIRNNKIQAADLENIASLLNVDICTFFKSSNPQLANNSVETNGDFSPASIHGNVTVGDAEVVLSERIKSLETLLKEKDIRLAEKDTLLAEKERIIKVYERSTTSDYKPFVKKHI